MSRRLRRLQRVLTAWMLGIRDGWEQPHDLSSSTNVDYLLGEGFDDLAVHEAQDRGINLGQILRAGHRSQAWREHWFRVTPWGLS